MSPWKKSDGEPEASTTVYGVDDDNRNLNARAPVGDANIYWDAGNDDTSSDNYGEYDQPQEQKTGVCCPRDQDAEKTPTGKWTCSESNQCGIADGSDCEYNISASEDAWFNRTSDGASNACNSQVPNLYKDDAEQPDPTKSQACCYVPKDGKEGWFYKDGNVKIYG